MITEDNISDAIFILAMVVMFICILTLTGSFFGAIAAVIFGLVIFDF